MCVSVCLCVCVCVCVWVICVCVCVCLRLCVCVLCLCVVPVCARLSGLKVVNSAVEDVHLLLFMCLLLAGWEGQTLGLPPTSTCFAAV